MVTVTDGLARLQALNILIGVVEVVGPVARRVDREGTIRTLAAIVDGPGVRVGRVNVGDVDLARGDQRAIFRDCAVSLAGQDRIVVGTVDGDRDFLRRDAAVAVVDRHGELLGQRFTHAQRLHGRVAVGQRRCC
ncbi:hypothetical protein G6F31_018496 [Rhizopus arrhizus]|nr:hypothetical protein G6F31_018496 [Rhizopus arrhizus]